MGSNKRKKAFNVFLAVLAFVVLILWYIFIPSATVKVLMNTADYAQKFEITVDKLREVFAMGNKMKLYKDFKKYTFGHAVNEINSLYQMNLQFEEIKESRKVAKLVFTFTPKKKVKLNPKIEYPTINL
jgi:plasmid replication initiation protein